MKRRPRLILFALLAALLLVAASAQIFIISPTPAQAGSPPPVEPLAQDERPFQLPFADPPGPSSWLMAQPYGNTTRAYYQRNTLYVRSGGIHFGVDLAAPCGTEIVAIADGVVFAVDGPFGSPPHNLMIDHPQLGYASMYGHLIEAPDLVPGQPVKQGEVVAQVGDSEGLCHRRPHLHLEIRGLNHVRKYNPATLIEADWDGLALIGDAGRSFMRDLAEPRKWQTLYDQPQARTGGPILNDFQDTWPFDWEKREANPVTSINVATAPSILAGTATTPTLQSSPIGHQITSGKCCTDPYWSPDSSEVLFVDQPAPGVAVGVWGVDLKQPGPASPQLTTMRLAVYSPDGRLIAYPDRTTGLAIVERLADGQRWEIDTQENGISFTPDSQEVMWATSDEDAPWDSRVETLWLADVDGRNARAVFSAQRTDPVAWLADDDLLLLQGLAGTSDVRLLRLSLKDGSVTELMEGPRMRGMALSPDRRYLVYHVRFEAEAGKNGVWLVDVSDPALAPQRLPFFGSYRWRDNQRLVYVPFAPDAPTHNFYEYDALTGRTRALFPKGTGLSIANNDWQVSPDGRKIALVAAKGQELDGIWVLEIDQVGGRPSSQPQ